MNQNRMKRVGEDVYGEGRRTPTTSPCRSLGSGPTGSRRNLRADTLDLDTLVAESAIARYGVSVEKTSEALSAIARPNLVSVQIILNAFRLKPLDAVLPAAIEAGVGIIARVPIASGLLSGKYTKDTVFAANDHRIFNRYGEAFDVGETFSGVETQRCAAS